MATYHAMVVTTWVEKPSRRDMRAAEDYPATWTDVTMQPDASLPCDPNALVVYGQGLSEAQATALQADANVVVLWIEAEV